jgi:hypothetical protein
VSEFLLRRFGIQFDPEVSYNERLKALTAALRGVRKKHLEFFQRHSQKRSDSPGICQRFMNHLPGVE